MVVAMHMSDGLVNAPTSLAFGLFAVLVLAVAVSRARADLDDRTAPMAGLVTAFVFAVQMINFPILPGASGHLLGGALVAILVGPWVGTLCIAIVLLVQGILFADGGLTALGLNITNMAIVGVFTGYLVARSLRGSPAAAGAACWRWRSSRPSSTRWWPRSPSWSSTRSAARAAPPSARCSPSWSACTR